jgi:hypothetical protein
MPLNNPRGGTQWTDDHCDELKRLAAVGKSFRAIAAEINSKFGTSYTRNSTIGKAARLGLAKQAAPNVKYSDRPRKPKQAGASVYRRATHNSNAMRLTPTLKLERLRCVEIDCVVPSALATGCQYPVGDGPFFMCDGPKQIGNYCLAHHAITHQPALPRTYTGPDFSQRGAA